MDEEPDWKKKQRGLQAALILMLTATVLGLLIFFTDWIVPRVLGSVVLAAMACAAVSLGIRCYREWRPRY